MSDMKRVLAECKEHGEEFDVIEEAKYGRFADEINKAIFACHSAMAELPNGLSARGKIQTARNQLIKVKGEVAKAKQLKEGELNEGFIPEDKNWQKTKNKLSLAIDDAQIDLEDIAGDMGTKDEPMKKEIAALIKKLDSAFTALDKAYNKIP